MSAGGRHWSSKAACFLETSSAPELWTPDRQPARALRKSMESLCYRCPVRRQCAAEAIRAHAEGGLFAGVWMPDRGERGKWDDAVGLLREIAGESAQFGVDYVELETSA
jgi:WhiB family redox-sensing transcriptional regulator